jgi:cholesterol transport system auxiliary component
MKRALIVVAMVLLASCSVLPKREPVKVYEPRAAGTPTPDTWPAVAWSLIVARPLGSQALDNERIAVRPADGAVQVYKGAVWTDNVNDLVQTALIRRLEDSGKIMAVSRSGSGGRGQYQLVLDIRDFSAVYRSADAAPDAVVEIRAKLLFTGTGDVVAAKSFRQAQPAAGVQVGEVIDAFSQSLARSTDDIAGWVLDSGQADSLKRKL